MERSKRLVVSTHILIIALGTHYTQSSWGEKEASQWTCNKNVFHYTLPPGGGISGQ